MFFYGWWFAKLYKKLRFSSIFSNVSEGIIDATSLRDIIFTKSVLILYRKARYHAYTFVH